MFKYELPELKAKAERLATAITAPHAILLRGDLGAGKTTFTQFFLKSILVDKNQSVSSPTFTIINTYKTIKGKVWHADLYRLKSEAELFELGLIEFAHMGITLIEWSDIIEPYIADIPKTIIEL